MRKLNLGCGPIHPQGWENVDGSLRAWIASHLSWVDHLLTRLKIWSPTEFNRNTRCVNLQKKFPWPDNSVDCIYLGEVLEHFTRDDGVRLLSECLRVLKPTGIIRVRVPDNVRFWRNYVQEFDENFSKPPAEWTEKHSRWVEKFFRDICVRRRWFGSFGHYHKWMYDDISLTLTLQRIGFTNVARRQFLDSAIPDIKDVEMREELTVEGSKPNA